MTTWQYFIALALGSGLGWWVTDSFWRLRTHGQNATAYSIEINKG